GHRPLVDDGLHRLRRHITRGYERGQALLCRRVIAIKACRHFELDPEGGKTRISLCRDKIIVGDVADSLDVINELEVSEAGRNSYNRRSDPAAAALDPPHSDRAGFECR